MDRKIIKDLRAIRLLQKLFFGALLVAYLKLYIMEKVAIF